MKRRKNAFDILERKIKGSIIWTLAIGGISYFVNYLGKPLELYFGILCLYALVMLIIWEEKLF